MKERFKESLKSDYFSEYSPQNDQIILSETNKNKPYNFKINKVKNTEYIFSIHDIEKLKEQYLKKNCPKDCDYILVDTKKKIVFFIELKSKSAGNSYEIEKQLKAGEHWFNHFLFCANIPTSDIKEYEQVRLCIRYDEKGIVRKSRRNRPIDLNSKYHYYETRGTHISYNRLLNYKDC